MRPKFQGRNGRIRFFPGDWWISQVGIEFQPLDDYQPLGEWCPFLFVGGQQQVGFHIYL